MVEIAKPKNAIPIRVVLNGRRGKNVRSLAVKDNRPETDVVSIRPATLTNRLRKLKNKTAKDTCPFVPHGAIGNLGARARPRAEAEAKPGTVLVTRPEPRPALVPANLRKNKTAVKNRVPHGAIGHRGPNARSLAETALIPEAERATAELRARAEALRILSRAIKDLATLGHRGPNGENVPHCAAAVPETELDNVLKTADVPVSMAIRIFVT